MQDDFTTIRDSFARAGVDVATAEYSITSYSLNTGLSFKFINLEEFLVFLGLQADKDTEKIESINSMLVDAGIDPNSFFFVNFYKPKVAEI